MLLDVADFNVPPGSRLLGYAVVHPWDELDYPTLLAEHCNRRSWVLDGMVTSEYPSSAGDIDDDVAGEWPRVLRVVRRLSATALITPSIEHLAPTSGSRHTRITSLGELGVAVRTLPSVAAVTL